MAWANKYLFKFNSLHGVEYNIYILKNGYSGSVIQRALGRAPILRKKQNGPISGTSLELYAQCSIDGEFSELYTSDPKEYKVEVYRGQVMIWTGFISTELYNEPSIAPPYDVQIVATDGLGELKLNSFEAQGEISLSSLFVYLLSFTGSDRAIHFAWDIKQYNSTVPDLLDNGLLDLDYKDGETQYEVLTYLLNSFHAKITAFNNVWLVTRETDLPSSGTSLSTYYIPAGGGAVVAGTLTGVIKSAGKMGVADVWPIGNLSTAIEPARKAVTLNSPWHINNILVNPKLVYSQGGWSISDHVTWYTNVNEIRIGPQGHFAYISQSFQLSYLSSELRMNAMIGGLSSASSNTSKLYFYVKYQTATATFYGDSDGWTETEPSSPRVPIDVTPRSVVPKFQNYEATIPAPLYNEPGTLTFYIAGQLIAVHTPYFTMDPTYKGYRDTVNIDNGARGADDEREILHGRILEDEFNYVSLLSGAIKKITNGVKSYIYKFEDSHNGNADFLSLTSLSYALSVALPRAKREGIIDIPSSLSSVPIFLTIENIRHLVETYDWDLYNEELKFVALSLPAASITVESETVIPLDDSNYSGSGSGSGGTGSGGAASGGLNMLKVWKALTNNEELTEYNDNTKIAAAHIPDISFFELDGNGNVKLKDTYGGLWTKGFLTAGGVGQSSGGGGGDVDLPRVWKSLQNQDTINTYNDYKFSTAHLPTLGAGLAYTDNQGSGASLETTLGIASGYKLPTTEEWANVADNLNSLQALQAQVDSLSTRDNFDELTAAAIFADILAASDIYGALHGNADTATNATNAEFATKDASGNTITSYYAKASDLTSVSNRVAALEARQNWDEIFGIDDNGNVYIKKNGNAARGLPRALRAALSPKIHRLDFFSSEDML